eukprot:464946-Amphidinium_carterae.1
MGSCCKQGGSFGLPASPSSDVVADQPQYPARCIEQLVSVESETKSIDKKTGRKRENDLEEKQPQKLDETKLKVTKS